MKPDLPTKKWLNLAAIKIMAAAAEAEARKRDVQVTICIVDEGGNLLFLQKADGTGLNTIQILCRRKHGSRRSTGARPRRRRIS